MIRVKRWGGWVEPVEPKGVGKGLKRSGAPNGDGVHGCEWQKLI